MAVVSCPKRNKMANSAGFPTWAVIVSICFFSLGLLALLAGPEPTRCTFCGMLWRA
jgi:hypothetical protein